VKGQCRLLYICFIFQSIASRRSAMPRFLPQEGLTWEAIFGFINNSALESLITGPVLLGLLYYPEIVISILPSNSQRYVESAAFVSSVKILLGCGDARKVNNFLSRVVLNNFT
jgi:hypothetical protein